MHRHLNLYRFQSVEECNGSEGRCHVHFNIGSQVTETYQIPFNVLSDSTGVLFQAASVPGDLVGGPRAYQHQFCGFKPHRVHARRDSFLH